MLSPDPFIHLLDDPWAPHPVVNRKTVCNGGGGGEEEDLPAPEAPDYTQYIAEMGRRAAKGEAWADELYTQAKGWGVDMVDTAKQVSGKAGAAADKQQAGADEGRDYWKGLSRPVYEAQQKETMRMNADLPAYQEHEAGRTASDAAISLDAQKAALHRKMLASGTAGGRPGIASQALDTMAAVGRSQATTAAAEVGRLRARDEARKAMSDTLKSEEFLANEASDQAKLATANRSAESDVLNKSAVAASSLYAPAHAMYGTSADIQKEWGNATNMGFQNRLGTYDAETRRSAVPAEEGGGETAAIMGTIGQIGGTVAGSYFGGPAGGMAGGMAGKAGGEALGKAIGARGGKIPPMGRRVPRGYAQGGAIDTSLPGSGNLVTPDMSPSGGEAVDDVPAVVSEGEFVIPERTVDWFGEQYFQKLIMKSDKERETQTVAAPDVAPNDNSQGPAVDMSAPMFRSEGARV